MKTRTTFTYNEEKSAEHNAEVLSKFLKSERAGHAAVGYRFIFGAEFSGDDEEHVTHKRAKQAFNVSVSEILRAARRTRKPLTIFKNLNNEIAVRSGNPVDE